MDRREAIKRTAIIMGGFAFAPSALGVLKGCTPQPGIEWNPQFFNNSQARLVSILTDIIIPSGETPGAADVGVPAFIEEMVSTIYDDEAREKFVSGLEAFNNVFKEQNGSDYADLDHDQQFQFAAVQNKLAIDSEHTQQPETEFFFIMKELTMLGYFTSEPGATETLRYIQAPGRYDGCVPFEEIGRAWAR
ncbi:MAG: gluconate 2-dehydrogenase subunit 3 family protein [Balneolales bacterium]